MKLLVAESLNSGLKKVWSSTQNGLEQFKSSLDFFLITLQLFVLQGVKEIIDQKMTVQIIDAFNPNLLTAGLAKAVLEKTFGLQVPLVISNFSLRFRAPKGS